MNHSSAMIRPALFNSAAAKICGLPNVRACARDAAPIGDTSEPRGAIDSGLTGGLRRTGRVYRFPCLPW